VFSAAEQGDVTALRVVEQGAAYINQIALRLFELQPPRFSMIGGLAYKLVPYLDKSVQQHITPALAAPEFGAIWYARQQQNLFVPAKAAIVN
jgi:glucosamine kinase